MFCQTYLEKWYMIDFWSFGDAQIIIFYSVSINKTALIIYGINDPHG